MTSNEKKSFLSGAAAGILIAVITLGVVVVKVTRPTRAAAPEIAATPVADQHAGHDAQETPGTQAGATVELTPEDITAAGVQTAEAKLAKVTTTVNAFGRVEQPEAQLTTISARIGGRIDDLLLQYTGQDVQRGQAVVRIYSPEVATALEEYRLAVANRERMDRSGDRESAERAADLVNASQRRLELLDIRGKQLKGNIDSGTPHVTIFSNASGVVVDRKVTRGQYVNAGDMLFTVADLSTVWVKADVYESQLPQVRTGQPVEITSDAIPNQKIHGRVEFIEPTANPQTRTVSVHVHVPNPGMRLRPGMYVAANFVSTAPQNSLVIPRSALLDTGTRKLVYVDRGNGVFEAREVEVGAPAGDLYPVTRGLKPGEKVVIAGNFLIDSQTRLNTGMTGLFGGSKEFTPTAQQGGTAQAKRATITFRTDPSPPKGTADTTFHVTLTGEDGKPIPDAQVKVTFVMPAMPAMGMAEMRNSFALSWMNGMYMGKGTIGMAGSWNVLVEATRNGSVVATYRTHVNTQ